MEVTVKTLDSQTKTFHVEQEITVKEFKAKIADEMKIPIEKQRLIFQGKVLQDDKPLQEYKVNGCVIHLVERQPPRATTRTNGQSTETTTSSTATTSSPGSIFLGAFAMPLDVMGVTQQIVQGIVQQMGAESAQANISTSSSDDGSSVNVHINLSTVMARNDARSRIAPARVHLNNVSRIIHRLQNDGLPSSRDLSEENLSTETRPPTSGTESSNNENSLGDLADVLQQVVRLNDEIRPHLERYQELLRSGTDRELRPADDLLPDLAAEALHSLSHAYHALSDVTTNFRVPEPRLNVLPSMSPVPASLAHARNTNSQLQTATSSTTTTAQTAGPTTGPPPLIPVGIGWRPGGGLGSSIGLRNGRGLRPGISIRPGFSLRPGNGLGATLRAGLPAGINLGNLGSTGSQATSVPPSSTATLTSTSNTIRPQNPQNPYANLPINMRNLPNIAVQFNPASGNITIAHIVTSVVEEPSLRTTTTTTNSTPTPRTSSWGSDHNPENQSSSTTQSDTPMAEGDSPAFQNDNAQSNCPTLQEDSNPHDSDMSEAPPVTTTSQPPSSSNHGGSQSAGIPRDRNAVVNFMPQNTGHRDPLLPCQSFHFASMIPRTDGGTSQTAGRGQTAPSGTQRQEPEGAVAETPRAGDVTTPEVIDFAELLNVGRQHAAAAAAQVVASNGNRNGAERNPFLDLFMPAPQSQEASAPRYPTEEFLLHMAASIEESQRTMSPEELAEDRGTVQGQGTLSRFLYCLLETIPLSQLLMTVVGGANNLYTLTRSMTRDFLRDVILAGAEATPENLQRATERILEELKETFESSFAQCNVKENIDAPATLLTYLRPKIRRLLELVNSSEPDSVYIAEISALLTDTSAELVALSEYCLQDGRAGMEAALRRSLSTSSAIASLDPNLRSMAVDTMWACVQEMQSETNVRLTSLYPFVVRKERKRKKSKDSSTPKLERKDEKKDECSRSSDSPRPSSRSSDTPRTSGNMPSSSHRTRSSSQPEEIPMDTDERWKKVIPADWVPVISQDIIRQQRMTRQAPFSDAYLNGMPPKRRKIQATSEPAPYNQCVSATLKRSITKAGVAPKTDSEKLNEEANSSQSLSRNFEDEVKREVRKRLAKDTDYNSEKFPSIHEYFEKDEKR